MAESLAEFFRMTFEGRGSERAYGQRRGYRMEWITYRQVLEMAVRFARELEGRQIVKADRIMLWGENSAEWVAAFIGCALSGVITAPMDNGASADFARRVFDQVDGKLLVCSRRHAKALWKHSVPTVVLEDMQSVLGHHPATGPDAQVRRDDILQIVFTSGTTADPRGVVIKHGNVLANIAPLETAMQGYLKYERIVHPIRFLNLLPLSHVFGQFLGMFLPPLLGGTVIFQEELKPSEVIGTIRRERVSVLASVPRVLQSLKQKIERDLEAAGEKESFERRFCAAEGRHFLRRRWTFRSIHRQFGWKFWAFISGGAALDRETEEFWGRLGFAAIQGYGLTETTSLISVNHPFRLGKGSIGKVLPGREVKLADDGEIMVRGAGVASGYWGAGEAQHVADDQGWYRTGDIGACDVAGNLFFKGRKKEVIVTPSGTNLYPDDLEAALRREPEVRDCVVVGIERGRNAEACAVLILREGADVEAVMKRANLSLAEYQRMHLWMQWPQEDFPRTNTQKPRRNVIQEFAQARAGRRGNIGGALPGDTLDSPLSELIARVTGRPVSGLTPEANLDSDLGLGSLDRVELLGALEDRYQLDLGDSGLNAACTVGDLTKILRGKAVRHTSYHFPRWTLRWPARAARMAAHYLLLRPAIVLLGWPKIEGRENLRGWKCPFLIVSNHVDHVDVGFILTALPSRIRHRLATAAGGEALEALRAPRPARWLLGRIYDRIQWALGVTLLNLFPLPRDAGFRESFAYAGEAVDRGYSVLVFPEGRHTTDGKLSSFRAGVGLLANNLGVPVVPMRIVGLFEVKKAGRRFAAPWSIRVRIGQPLRFNPGTPPEEIVIQLQKAEEAL
jgi:long-chain acyl-CoA synthetase